MNSRLLAFLLLTATLLRCGDSDSIAPTRETNPINASILITVLDPAGDPVKDAVVSIGNLSGQTDEHGLYFFNNADITDRAHVKIEKPGYFKGSRTLYASEGAIQYATITLLNFDEVGTFPVASGGLLNVDSRSSLNFPQDAVVRKDGTPYTGVVHVKAYTIHADDPDLSTKMPGILEGRNQSGEWGMLSSYGMMAVEIQSPSGEELKVKDGKKVKMEIEVPADMRNAAPGTIPLWYFDEEEGEWQQEGTAVFNGSAYEAEVGHFSIWNCDDWNESVNWRGQFVDESGKPLANMTICMTIVNSQATRCDNTDTDGNVTGYLPSGEMVELKVVGECGNAFMTQPIGPYTEDEDYGPVTVTLPTESISVVTGLAVDCEDQPVTNGYAIISLDTKHYVTSLNPADGSFIQKFLHCDQSSAAVVVVDVGTQKQSKPVYVAYFPEINTGTLKACDELKEYLTIAFEGFTEQYFFAFPSMTISAFDQTTTISVSELLQGDASFGFNFGCTTPGPCAVSSGGGRLYLPNGEFVFVLGLDINLIEYGPVGGDVKGTFTGQVNGGGNGQGGPGYTDFTGTFSVIRGE
ncbi:MAG TPA: carboxypeptidase-like regulatory domain-containing protein [Saprospiraceae bacterium]|nr:carboxypeptidase-like regulatory domain-containing protein [Saprospiraceae bacterium]